LFMRHVCSINSCTCSSNGRSEIPSRKASRKDIASLPTACLTLAKLKSGNKYHLVKRIQCVMSNPMNLAYISHKIRHGFSLRHLSTNPSLFHTRNSISTCQRTLPIVNISCADNPSTGRFVKTISHPARIKLSFLGITCFLRAIPSTFSSVDLPAAV